MMPGRILLGLILAWMAGQVDSAISYRVSSDSVGNATSATLTLPQGTGEGDLMIAAVAVRARTTAQVTAPSGWTSIAASNNNNSSMSTQTYYRVATASDVSSASTSWSWTWSGTRRFASAIVVFRGVDTASFVSATQSANPNNATNNSTVTIPAVTPAAASSLLVAIAANTNADQSYSSWSGSLVERVDVNSAGGTGGVALGIATEPGAAASVSTGTRTVSLGANNNNKLGIMIALRPATVPGPRVYWKFDESAWSAAPGQVLDASGNGFHGQAFNGASPTTASAKFCRSASFASASQQYVEVAHAGALSIDDRFTVSAWVRPSSLPGSGLMTIASKDTNWEFHLTPTGAINWWWSSGTNQITTAAGAVATGAWTHVAIVYTRGAQEIFVNGTRVANNWANPDRGLTATNSLPLQVGQDQGAAGRFFNGLIDEFRLYPWAFSEQDVASLYAEVPAACVLLDHIRIEHDGAAGTCAPETVTVKACADAACASTYTDGSVTTTLSPTGWVGGNTVTFTGSTTKSLVQTSAGTVTLGASGTTPVPSGATQCLNTAASSSSCSLTYSANTLTFDAPNHVSANTVQFTVSGCTAFGTSTRTVNFWTTYQNPGSGTLPVRLAAGTVADCVACTAVSGSSGSPTPLSLSFTGGSATVSLFYSDVGQVRLDAAYGGSSSNTPDDTGVSITGGDSFTTRPGTFTVSDVKSGSTPNPGATDATGAKFVRAGDAFEATVTARNAKGDATPNFGKESSPEGVTLTSSLVAPAGGNAATLSLDIPGASFVSGAATPTTLRWRETGIITLTPSLTSGSYLGTGTVTGTASGNIGRFHPWQFALTAGALGNRSGLSCSPASTFTYMGENLSLSFSLTAQSDLGGTTQNYTGAFAKLDLASASSYGVRAVGTSPSAAVTDLTGRVSVVGTPAGSWSNGVATGIALAVQVARNSTPDGPYTSVQFGVDPTDADGVKVSAYDLATTPPFSANDRVRTHAPAAATGLRFGRIRAQNAIGSERLALAVPLAVQYWEDSGTLRGFVTNTADSCTTVPTTAVGLGSYTGSLSGGDTAISTVTPGQISFTAGAGDLRLTAPGAGKSGSVDLVINLGNSTTIADSCVPPAWTPDAPTPVGGDRAYLRGDWCSTGYDRDPKARARFGAFGLPRSFIYRRENF